MAAAFGCGAMVLVFEPAVGGWCEGNFELVTVVPGGGLKVNWAASGRAKSTALNATSNTLSGTDLANTWTRSGTCSVPSMATRTCDTSEVASLGSSTSS